MADDNKAPEVKPEQRKVGLMDEAMAAFGILPEHVLARRDNKTHVVIITKGGTKVTFAPGDKVRKLSKVALDGVAPKKVEAEADE